MSSMTAGGWWERVRAPFTRPAAETPGRFAEDALDAHATALQVGAVLLLAFLTAFSVPLFLDGDTGWHLGTGTWILDQRAVPVVDPFSFTHPGKAWTAHEWLAQIAMVSVKNSAGWAGLNLLFAVAMALTLWPIASEAFRRLPARHALLALAVVAGLLLPFTLARPHMLAWPLLALWTLVLLQARERNAAPPLAAALLMVAWANLHASYIVAFAIAGLFGLESLLANWRNRALFGRWILFGLASLAAALVTPLGPSHFLYPFEVSGMEALQVIGEWRRSTPLTDVLFFACAAGLLILIGRLWRNVPPLRLLLLAGLTVMAVLHARHQMLFAIVGSLVLLFTLAPAAAAKPRTRTVAALLLPGLALLAVARLLVPLEFRESGNYPLSLIASLPPELRAQPVFNHYSAGGPLVMLGIRPYIDGRADMYGDDFTFRSVAIIDGDMDKFRQDVARFGIRWVLLKPDQILAARLAREPGWHRFAADEHAVVYVRAN